MKMMTKLDQIIRSRKSIYPKDYNGVEVTQSEIEDLLSTIVYTPNHKKTTPWKFTVFRGASKDKLGNELGRLYKEKTPADKFLEKKYNTILEKVNLSSAIITLVVNYSNKVPHWEEEASLAMAVQNMWLKATEIGVGGYWSSPNFCKYLDEFLMLNEHQKCKGLFYIGKSDMENEIRDRNWKEFVEFKD